MEVKEFVKNMLKDITEAIEESNNKNYKFVLLDSRDAGISFDLSVVLKEQKNGKIGAEVFSVIGAKVEGQLAKENVNRIAFKVLPSKNMEVEE